MTNLTRLYYARELPKGGIDIPNKPTFLHVDELVLNGIIDRSTGELVDIKLSDKNVLFCHAKSTPHQFVSYPDRFDLPTLIKQFREGNDLHAVIACNEGRYLVGDDLIYPIGNPLPIPCCYNNGSRIKLDAHLNFSRENPEFHIPSNYK